MSKTIRKTCIAGLTLALAIDAGAAPTEMHLLPAGEFRAVDGRPADVDAWRLSADSAARVIARASARHTDIVIDFEHQTLNARLNGQRAEAAGWIPRTLEWRLEGLFATEITWVGDTADLITQKKYRYVSAVFIYDGLTGEVLELISVALTNTPALDGLEALADLARAHSVFSTEEEAEMPDEKQLAALAAERDGLQTKVAALTQEKGQLTDSVTALTAKVAALTAAEAERQALNDNQKRDALLLAALNDGRLVPAQKPWAEKQSLAALTEYLEATAPIPLAKGPQHQPDNNGGHGLTDDQLAMCTRMNVTPEQFLEAQKTQK